MIDPSEVIAHSMENVSNLPVTTARYILEVVMNEDDPDADAEQHKQAFSDEFQRALDDGYFADLRYSLMLFEVSVASREVLHVAPPGDHK